MLAGYEPEAFPDGDKEYSELAVAADGIHRLIIESINAKEIAAVNSPSDWVNWAIRKKFTLPDDLGKLVITNSSAKVGGGGTAKPEWVQKAWSIGEAWMLAEEKRTKKRPSIVEIAKHVESEFKRLDIQSKRLNDYLDWQTIKKEALTGITGRKQGENFKNTMGNPQRKKRSHIART